MQLANEALQRQSEEDIECTAMLAETPNVRAQKGADGPTAAPSSKTATRIANKKGVSSSGSPVCTDTGTQRDDDSQFSQGERDRRAMAYVQQMMLGVEEAGVAGATPAFDFDPSGGMALTTDKSTITSTQPGASGTALNLDAEADSTQLASSQNESIPPARAIKFVGTMPEQHLIAKAQIKLRVTEAVRKLPRLSNLETEFAWVDVHLTVQPSGHLCFYYDEATAVSAKPAYNAFVTGQAWDRLAAGESESEVIPELQQKHDFYPEPVPLGDVSDFEMNSRKGKSGHRLFFLLDNGRGKHPAQVRFNKRKECLDWLALVRPWSDYAKARASWVEHMLSVKRAETLALASSSSVAQSTMMSPPLAQPTPRTQVGTQSIIGLTITPSLPNVSQLTQTQEGAQSINEDDLMTDDALTSQENWFNTQPATQPISDVESKSAEEDISVPAKKRGRPKKVQASGNDNYKENNATKPTDDSSGSQTDKLRGRPELLGATVRKLFPGHGWYTGVVQKFKAPYYWIAYEDADYEELREEDVRRVLLSGSLAPSQTDSEQVGVEPDPVLAVSSSSVASVAHVVLDAPGVPRVVISRATLDSILVRTLPPKARRNQIAIRATSALAKEVELARMLCKDAMQDETELAQLMCVAREASSGEARTAAVEGAIDELRNQAKEQARELVAQGWAADSIMCYPPDGFNITAALRAAPGQSRVLRSESATLQSIVNAVTGKKARVEVVEAEIDTEPETEPVNVVRRAETEPEQKDPEYLQATEQPEPDTELDLEHELLTQPQVEVHHHRSPPQSIERETLVPKHRSTLGVSARVDTVSNVSPVSGTPRSSRKRHLQESIGNDDDLPHSSQNSNNSTQSRMSSIGKELKKRRESLDAELSPRFNAGVVSGTSPRRRHSALGLLLKQQREGIAVASSAPVRRAFGGGAAAGKQGMLALVPSGRPVLGAGQQKPTVSTIRNRSVFMR